MMADSHDSELTADIPADHDSLDAGLAAAFGSVSQQPAAESILAGFRHTYGDLRPVMLHDADGESAHVVRPHSAEMPELHETGARYQLSGEIARGGMGAVLRGRDVDLGRDLAVKVLLDKFARRPEVARRFLEEAQVGAQLQHPGIVPVYDIGRFGDRPFFTMKLVKGRTLSAFLAERIEPAHDGARFLGIALQVAQTLAYAHAKGVIHRDLKPANVMVGAFGEVQVMDWGLAKVLTEGGVADEEQASRAHRPTEVNPTVIRTARSGSAGSGMGTDTEAGSLLGTPAYMSPEQANGDVERLDRRADVFGLGAILCEILTGQPPYVGRSAEEVRRKAAYGDQAETLARLDTCGADAEQIALTKACLSPEPIDRPRDAQAVADQLGKYLNGVQERLRHSEIERAEAVVKATEYRKRIRVQLALAASVISLIAFAGSAGLWWWTEQAALTKVARAALSEARAHEQAGRWQEAKAAVERAESKLGAGGPTELREEVHATKANVAVVTELEEIRLRQFELKEGRIQSIGIHSAYAMAFARYGIDVCLLDPRESGRRIAAAEVREQLVVAIDNWDRALQGAELSYRDRLREVVDRADDDAWRKQFRIAVRANDGKRMIELADPSKTLGQPPTVLCLLAAAMRDVDQRIAEYNLLVQTQQRYPSDFLVNLNLGYSLASQTPPRNAEAISFFRVSLALSPKNPLVSICLGCTLRDQRDLEGAIIAFRRAAALAPTDASAHEYLGAALQDQSDLDGAVACFRKTLELDPNNVGALSRLGSILCSRADLDTGMPLLKKALAVSPNDVWTLVQLGNALLAKNDRDGARESFRKALDLGPREPRLLIAIGKGFDLLKDGDGAEAAVRRFIDLDRNSAAAHLTYGLLLADRGDFELARLELRRALTNLTKPEVKPFWLEYMIKQLDRKVELDRKIPMILKGDPTSATAAERIELADICRKPKHLFATAARLYTEAFAMDPKLSVAVGSHRYAAACCAALAGFGKGADAAALNADDRTRFRSQALELFQAELKSAAMQLGGAGWVERKTAAKSLRDWQQDADLASVRGDGDLSKLPETERAVWQRLWTDVEELLKKAEKP